MKRYLKVFLLQLNNNLSIEIQYRKNFVIRILSQLLFVVLQVLLIEIYFRFTNQIGSWSRPEVFLLAGVFRLVEGAFHMFFHENLLSLPETVNQGDMDGLITKPINTLFLVSTRHHQLYEISTYLSGFIIIVYALGTSNISIIFLSFLASILGLIALFSIMLIISFFDFLA